MVAASSRQKSILFAPLGATVSLRSCRRGQAMSGQDWRGARNVGRWRGTSTIDRAPPGWSLAAVPGRWPAGRHARSSRGLCYVHWSHSQFEAPRVDWIGGTGLAGGRTEVRPASQTSRFRSRSRDQVATTDLLVDERAQVRAGIEDQHWRRGHARTLGRSGHLQKSLIHRHCRSLEHPAASRPLIREDPVSGIPLAWSQWR